MSLIGKFLTCKPFNKRAAKTTLRRAWGLENRLQIIEVGPNLFQFKFETEFDIKVFYKMVLGHSTISYYCFNDGRRG